MNFRFLIRRAASRTPWLLLLLLALLAGGCASSRPGGPVTRRPFVFGQDTLAFANELVWEYRFDDATGVTTTKARVPKPAYTHHCFVVVRSARQFFQHARFEPAQPRPDEAGRVKLIREVVSRSEREYSADAEKIVIPGYTNLFDFSRANEKLLKENCGGAWQSYLQRGNWRVVFPVPRSHQARIAEQVMTKIRTNQPVIVHLALYPSMAVNHALLLYGVEESGPEVRFRGYDPNTAEAPVTLTYHREQRQFIFPRNLYFQGGEVNVFEIYHTWNY